MPRVEIYVRLEIHEMDERVPVQHLRERLGGGVVQQAVVGVQDDGEASESPEVALYFLVVVVGLVAEREGVLELEVPAQIGDGKSRQYGENGPEKQNGDGKSRESSGYFAD